MPQRAYTYVAELGNESLLQKNRILLYKDNLIGVFHRYTKVCQWRSSAGPGSASQIYVIKKGIYVQLCNIPDVTAVKE